MRWSPRGDLIVYGIDKGLVVLDPSTRESTKFPYIEDPTWVSNDTLVGAHYLGSYNDLWLLDIKTGKTRTWKKPKKIGEPYGQIMTDFDPLIVDGFVVCEAESIGASNLDVVVRDQKWELRGTVWKDPGNNIEDMMPRINRSGEIAAWTRARSGGSSRPKCVALRHLKKPGSKLQTIGLEFQNAYLFDWTSGDNLLVGIEQGGEWQMVVMDLKGKVVRKISTPNGIRAGRNWATPASWRHFRHWSAARLD